ncbi:SDR family oxidoreductase [Singulisphaera acidiphila]|uniref:Putative nucleoside-diphosphate sugar epimerase n=1 Tax=Singulisphaera acidiphila (strain ATCC BAA-1392 / DSM 18658 / VKM B-2454 / MOB10) TaxID=886293 RepID=L0DDA8_SINAD|nr:NAD(P)H-binding protein [Singulisphaera acidiphila]AGA27237.1 putative nucleoside-diphosphate sugar epimerase [Singulisphaera acidiphila DSM 18658]
MGSVILVTGATGNVGRRVVSDLLRTGARVRALTRNPDTANLPAGVEVVRGDLSVPRSLDGCLAEVEAVFLLLSSPTSAETAPAFLETVAKQARRIVFLSSSAIRDDVEQQTNLIGKIHADLEHLIERSGLEWTFVRPGAFATNARGWWAPQIRVGDVVRWPYGAAVTAPIHERDIAAVAARALTETGHERAKYVLTGPEPLTQADQVRTIGEAIGRPLRFEEISPETARQQMRAFMPPPIVEVLLEVWSKLVDEPTPITNTVAEITGTPAHTFREWAIDHADDFRRASENSNSPSQKS